MKKVVLLGDSIRLIGYGTKLPEILGADYDVWQPEENCRFSNYTLRMVFEHQKFFEDVDIIHWNNGLWDVADLFGDGNFNDINTYVYNMTRVAKVLQRYAKKVIFSTTTPIWGYSVSYGQNTISGNQDIEAYNAAVVPVLQSMGIHINDLYSFISGKEETYIREDDRVHLSDAGIDACANQIANVIRRVADTIV